MDADPEPPTGPREPRHELTLGRGPVGPARIEYPGKAPPGEADDAGKGRVDPAELAGRCRGVAGAVRRAEARLASGGATGSDPDAEAWADRYFWANGPESGGVGPEILDDLAGAFEVLAAALEHAAAAGRNGPRPEEAYPALAEAQSALRAAVRRLGVDDLAEQVAAYDWLRTAAAGRRVFLRRYMRADDLADPAGWRDRLARVQELAGRHDATRRRASAREALLSRLSPLLGPDGRPADWDALARAVDEAVAAGVPAGERALVERLAAIVDTLPDRDDWPAGFRAVLRQVDRDQAARDAAPADEPTPEVAEARRLLEGRTVVLIGGARRPGAQRQLVESLGLAALDWVETKEHQPVRDFEPAVARAGVAVVLLAIRWSSHAFRDVRGLCDRHGVPLVRLPGGYGPNQVAAQVLAQCGDRLSRP